jgi:Trk K+ transport system NAD-binding subunit
MGAKKVMVLIQRKAYVDLVQGSVIDIAISPQQATISALLSHVRKADIVGAHCAAVSEPLKLWLTAMKVPPGVVGRAIDEIKLPPGTIIGAVVRGNDVMIANNNCIEQGDRHYVLTDKKFIPDVERYSSQVLSSFICGGLVQRLFIILYISGDNIFSNYLTAMANGNTFVKLTSSAGTRRIK